MVKIPKGSKARVIFFDAKGKFVAQSERYQKAKVVQKLFRGKYETIVDLRGTDRRVTPKLLADLLTRDDFENLAPNYSDPQDLKPTATKFTAWDIAGKMEGLRGIRGHMVKVTMVLTDGKQTKRVPFFMKVRRKGRFQYSLFRQMNKALGNEKMYLYNRIGSKLFPDRKGSHVHLSKVEIQKEL